MVNIEVKNKKVIVDHDYKSSNRIADELIEALDIICADLYVNCDLTNEEKVRKAIKTRNEILISMTKKEYSCEEYFD
jgi:hypothetical protein